MPVLIIGTYDKNGVPDAMNAAWGGMFNEGLIGICLDKGHKTVANLLERKAFTVAVADADHLVPCDYVGIVSANDVDDKIRKSGLTPVKSANVDAPVFDELPMTLECELVSFDEKTGCTVGNIINVSAEEAVLTDGKIDPSKVKPITFDPVNHTYVGLGAAVGNAFSDGERIK